jgi:uncharacterized protein
MHASAAWACAVAISRNYTMVMAGHTTLNVLGTVLQSCSTKPLTGFYRDGYCRTGSDDRGRHIVAAVMTEEFLAFSRARGNDLSTPRPEYGFPGLKPDDAWCLCALRWLEAEAAGVAPPVRLEATHVSALGLVPLDKLKHYALPAISP